MADIEKIQDTDRFQPIFVVGCPRSGTTLIGELVARVVNVARHPADVAMSLHHSYEAGFTWAGATTDDRIALWTRFARAAQPRESDPRLKSDSIRRDLCIPAKGRPIALFLARPSLARRLPPSLHKSARTQPSSTPCDCGAKRRRYRLLRLSPRTTPARLAPRARDPCGNRDAALWL